MLSKNFIETEKGRVAQVKFTLPDSIWADNIYLVGDFNDWHTSSHPMRRGREGGWSLTMDLQVGRSYQFRYLVDGSWMNESQADGYVHNPYGSDNSVVETSAEDNSRS